MYCGASVMIICPTGQIANNYIFMKRNGNELGQSSFFAELFFKKKAKDRVMAQSYAMRRYARVCKGRVSRLDSRAKGKGNEFV